MAGNRLGQGSDTSGTGAGVSPEGTEPLGIFQTLPAEFQERLLEDARILRRAAGQP